MELCNFNKDFENDLKIINTISFNDIINLEDIDDLVPVHMNSKIFKDNDFRGFLLKQKKIDNDINKILFDNYRLLDYKKSFKYNKLKYLIIFKFGSIVFWNFNENEIKNLLDNILNINKNLKLKIIKQVNYVESEIVDNTDKIIKNYIINHTIFLDSKKFEEKISVSFALGLSNKLSLIEQNIKILVNDVKFNKNFNYKFLFSKKNHIKNIGNHFLINCSLNADLSFINEPIFIYEYEEFYNQFYKVKMYYQLEYRVEIANQKLDYIKDIIDEVQKELNKKQWLNIYYAFIIWLALNDILILYKSIYY